MHHLRRRIGLAVVAVIVATSCSSDDDVTSLPDPTPTSPTSEATTTTSSTTTTTTEAPDESIPTPADGEAFDEYIATRVEAFFDLLNEAFVAPSPEPEVDYPGFQELASGEQLTRIYEQQRKFAREGQRAQEPSEPAVGTSTDEEFRISRVIDNTGQELTVRACEVDDEDLVDAETGEILIAGVITIERIVTLELVDETWKVTFTRVTDKVEGIGGCYFASETELPF